MGNKGRQTDTLSVIFTTSTSNKNNHGHGNHTTNESKEYQPGTKNESEEYQEPNDDEDIWEDVDLDKSKLITHVIIGLFLSLSHPPLMKGVPLEVQRVNPPRNPEV